MMRSIKRILMHACLITSVVVGSGNNSVVAQELAQDPAATRQVTAEAAQEALIKKNLFTVTPSAEVELKQEDVVPVSLQFAASPNTAEPLDLTGITATGFTRVVSVDGNSIAQVVVTRLVKGEDFVDLKSDSFTSQFAVESERLVPTTSVAVDGDEAEFVRAVAMLNGNEEDAPEEEAKTADNVVDDSSDVKENSGENPIAGGYETPERQEAEEEEERAPNITFNVTTDGCEPIIDLPSELVRQTSKSETLEDGIVAETDACSPNGTVWPIKRNYSVCEYDLDIAAGYATAQYMSYYNDDRGARFDLSSCQPDDERRYSISEVEGSCERKVDLATGEVTVFTQKVYQDASNSKVIAVECAASPRTYTIERNYDACKVHVDLEAGFATAQYLNFYTDDRGGRFDLTSCQPDNESRFLIKDIEAGCKPQVDLDAALVTLFTQKVYTDDNNTQIVAQECSASDKTYQIDRDFALCDDVVDLEKMSAFPQFRQFYKTDEEELVLLSACKMDKEQPLPLTEVEASCGLDFDLVNGLALASAQLMYTNLAEVEVMARDCAPATTIEPIKMTADTSNCSLQHDFARGQSVQMMMWTYLKDGVAYQATPCITTDTTYDHKKVYQKNGIDVCTPIVNLAKKQVAMQYRTEITVGGTSQIVAACQPDNSVVGIYVTTDGCTDPGLFQHDMSAGVSYGRERSYYNSTTGQGRVYVSECQTGSTRYTHSLEPSGWKYDDAKLQAWPLVNVSIKPNGTPYVIAQDYLQAGSTALSYSLINTQYEPNVSGRYYNGCSEYMPTTRTGTYARPDGSTFTKPLGAGPAFFNGDKCVREQEEANIDGYRAKAVVGGTSLYMKDGAGKTLELHYRGGKNGAIEQLYEGNGPYTFLGIGITPWDQYPNRGDFTENKCAYYVITKVRLIRTKITYPTGQVTYTAWQEVDQRTSAAGGYGYGCERPI